MLSHNALDISLDNLSFYANSFGQRSSLRVSTLCIANMADKSRTKLKRERNKEKQEGRKRKRSENDDVEIAKHYETL